MHYAPPQITPNEPIAKTRSVRIPSGRLFQTLPDPTPPNYRYIPCKQCGHSCSFEADHCTECGADLDPLSVVSRFTIEPTVHRTSKLRAIVLLSLFLPTLLLILSALVVLGVKEPPAYVGVAMMAAGCLRLAALAVRESRRGRMKDATAARALDRRPLVLFLRPFHRDQAAAKGQVGFSYRISTAFGLNPAAALKTFEELLTNELYVLGPVVAIGNPRQREQGPVIGAHRLDASDQAWFEEVVALAKQAQLIVLVLDDTAGLALELDLVTAAENRPKLLLIIPVLHTEDQRRSFYETYLNLTKKYPYLPTFNAAIVAISFEREGLEPEPLLAPCNYPDGEVRALVVAAWLTERTDEIDPSQVDG